MLENVVPYEGVEEQLRKNEKMCDYCLFEQTILLVSTQIYSALKNQVKDAKNGYT